MSDVVQCLKWALSCFVEWFVCVLEPIRTLRDILDESGGELFGSKAARIWIASFIVILVCHYPAYALYDVSYRDPMFVVATFFGSTMTLIGSGVAIHLMLKAHRIDSDGRLTLRIYTVIAAAYAPFEAFLSLPAAAQSLNLLHSLRVHKAGMSAAAWSIMSMMQHPVNRNGFLSAMALFVLGSINLIYLMFFSEAVAFSYEVSRPKVYRATALGMLLGALPDFIAQVFVLLSEYGAIHPR